MKTLDDVRLFLLDMDGTFYLGNELARWTSSAGCARPAGTSCS